MYRLKNYKYLKYWNKLYSKDDYFGKGPTKLAIDTIKIFEKHKVKRILEIGCGQGRDALFFAQQGYEVNALDISENAVSYINKVKNELKLDNLNVKVHDIFDPFDYEKKFDFVYSNLVLQFFHKNELSGIFANISNFMKDDSLFFFSTKKKGDKYYEKGEKINENAFSYDGITRYFYDHETWHDLLPNHFDIVDFDSNYHLNIDSTTSVWWKILLKSKTV